jgi:hypothetical protein
VFFSGRRKRSEQATLFGKRRNQAFAIDRHPEPSLDAFQDLGTCKGERAFLSYVEGHIHLRQTLAPTRLGRRVFTVAEAAHRSELCLRRCVRRIEEQIV